MTPVNTDAVTTIYFPAFPVSQQAQKQYEDSLKTPVLVMQCMPQKSVLLPDFFILCFIEAF